MVQFSTQADREVITELSVTIEIWTQFFLFPRYDPSSPGCWTINKKKLGTGRSICAFINSDSTTDFLNGPSSSGPFPEFQQTQETKFNRRDKECTTVFIKNIHRFYHLLKRFPPYLFISLHIFGTHFTNTIHCEEIIFIVCRENWKIMKVYFRQSNSTGIKTTAIRWSGKDLN